jgi:homoserine kinase type II
MSANSSEVEAIWSKFAGVGRASQIEELGNHGGFSGARLWRVETSAGRLCLRAWPPGLPTEAQLRFIHRVLRHVRDEGLRFIPAPLVSRSGSTFVRQDGRLWELTPWMPGRADYRERPSRARLRAAMHALARFHLAAGYAHGPAHTRVSRTLARRVHELRTFLSGQQATELRRRVPDGRWPELDARAVRLLQHVDAQRSRLDAMLRTPLPTVPQQPVIRDVWHDHVLFEGDDVSAIIDFGAMAIDTPAVDIARLLGSLIDGDASAWSEGLATYSELRPLSLAERALLVTLDRTGIFAGGLVWLRWHYLEQRIFENRSGVLARVDHFLHRLETADHQPPARDTHSAVLVASA